MHLENGPHNVKKTDFYHKGDIWTPHIHTEPEAGFSISIDLLLYHHTTRAAAYKGTSITKVPIFILVADVFFSKQQTFQSLEQFGVLLKGPSVKPLFRSWDLT